MKFVFGAFLAVAPALTMAFDDIKSISLPNQIEHLATLESVRLEPVSSSSADKIDRRLLDPQVKAVLNNLIIDNLVFSEIRENFFKWRDVKNKRAELREQLRGFRAFKLALMCPQDVFINFQYGKSHRAFEQKMKSMRDRVDTIELLLGSKFTKEEIWGLATVIAMEGNISSVREIGRD